MVARERHTSPIIERNGKRIALSVSPNVWEIDHPKQLAQFSIQQIGERWRIQENVYVQELHEWVWIDYPYPLSIVLEELKIDSLEN